MLITNNDISDVKLGYASLGSVSDKIQCHGHSYSENQAQHTSDCIRDSTAASNCQCKDLYKSRHVLKHDHLNSLYCHMLTMSMFELTKSQTTMEI